MVNEIMVQSAYWFNFFAIQKFYSARKVKTCLLAVQSAVWLYRARKKYKGMQILLSNSQARTGRTVKQEQEEISRNHVQTFIYLSVSILRKCDLVSPLMLQFQVYY